MKFEPCLILFAVSVARAAVLGATIGDALAIAALAGLYGYRLYLDSKTELPINEEVKDQIAELKGSVSALKLQRTLR